MIISTHSNKYFHIPSPITLFSPQPKTKIKARVFTNKSVHHLVSLNFTNEKKKILIMSYLHIDFKNNIIYLFPCQNIKILI